MADRQYRVRRVLALAIGIPSALFFLMSMARPLMGDSGSTFDPVLSATCHRLPSRSLHLPWGTTGLCARCTSFWFAMAAASGLLLQLKRRPPFWTGLLLFVPLVVDGLMQKYTPYESTNLLRVITGLAAGAGIPFLALGENRGQHKQGDRIGSP